MLNNMKKLILVFGFVLVTVFGCEKSSRTKSSIKIQDLIGTWVSTDSTLRKNESGMFVYTNDTLLFSYDITDSVKGIIEPILHRNFLPAHYGCSIIEIDTLLLVYKGPVKVYNMSKHKIEIKENHLIIGNNDGAFPSLIFNEYRKSQ